jgi:solute carrier family 25 citrate transporter 1
VVRRGGAILPWSLTRALGRPPLPAAGPLALWKGLIPRLARTPPGQAIVWAVSDQITGYFERQRQMA